MKKLKNEQMDDFLLDLEILCKEYGISISHEDTQGAFIIEDYKQENIDWMKQAIDKMKRRNI